jgi:hypothetical protein
MGVLWVRAMGKLRRAFCAVAILLVAVLSLITVEPVWNAMPRAIQDVQFAYRFNTDVTVCVCGLVLISALALERSEVTARWRRAMEGALFGAAVISIGLCIWQLWVPRTLSYAGPGSRSVHTAPVSWYDTSYYDLSQPVVPSARARLTINPTRVTGDDVTLMVTPPRGPLPFATNIAGGPYVVRLAGGLIRAGRMPSGVSAARREEPKGTGPVRITLSPAGGAIAVGRIISLLAVLAVLMAAVVVVVVTAWRLASSPTRKLRRESGV